MRFAFILPNLVGGGAEKALLKLAQQLVQRGHEVHVILFEQRIEHEVPTGVVVTSLGAHLSRGWLHKRILAYKLHTYILTNNSWHLIVSSLPFADEVATLARLPHHWCRIANTLSIEIERLKHGNSNKAHRRMARYQRIYGSHPLIAVSDGVEHDLTKQLHLDTRIETIPNPFNFDAIKTEAIQPCSSCPNTPYVIHVGRFAPQKRHDLLLDAWKELELPHLLVLLTSSSVRLESMISERGLNDRVLIAGFQTDPYPWIARAELLVLCSDHEGLPNVLIESLICGTPAISTDCPSGPREILGEDFPECLIPCGDSSALAKTIKEHLEHPPSPADANLDRYSADNVVHAYERLAQEL